MELIKFMKFIAITKFIRFITFIKFIKFIEFIKFIDCALLAQVLSCACWSCGLLALRASRAPCPSLDISHHRHRLGDALLGTEVKSLQAPL